MGSLLVFVGGAGMRQGHRSQKSYELEQIEKVKHSYTNNCNFHQICFKHSQLFDDQTGVLWLKKQQRLTSKELEQSRNKVTPKSKAA